MEIDGPAATVRLSVREFAEFTLTSSGFGRYRPWRAQLGTQWHQTLQSEEPHARAEVSVNAIWMAGDWRFEFQGRIDQVLDDPASKTVLIREIKTTELPLPLAEDEIRARCDGHLRQLATYMVLLPVMPEYANTSAITGELVLVDIRSGCRQTIPLEHDVRPLFDQQLDRLASYLERNRQRFATFQSITIRPPFEDWREGQPEAVAALDEHSVSHPFIFFQAPTGFGKTGVVLHYALRQMQRRLFSRTIYLTGKSTGQIQAAIQLRRMLPDNGSLRYFQMRNRREHAIESPRHTCRLNAPCEEADDAQQNAPPIDADELFDQQRVSIGDIRQLGARTGTCPYSISRQLLAHAEIWLCDYNYVFAPGQQHILGDQPGYSPATTLLIVDEAHNLPSRLCDAYSFALSAAANDLVTADILSHDVPRKLEHAWRSWTAWLKRIPRASRHQETLYYELIDQIDSLAQTFQAAAPTATNLPQTLVNATYQLIRNRDLILGSEMPRLLWSPAAETLHCQCLEPAALARQTLTTFGQVIFTSATLHPFENLRSSLGLTSGEVASIDAHCPWRDDAYSVAVDTRVDTRLKTRAHHYQTTAETVLQLAAAGDVPIAAFFPSYRYAETIRTYVQTLDPSLNVAIQPRNINLTGQLEFLDEMFLTAHALFFVLGSSFSESIDHLGGRVSIAMIVGPALPEVNPVQDARMQLHSDEGRETAFDRNYRQPAMCKINQALGRLVRSPGQSAAVLLHCRRFAELPYLNALSPEYQNISTVRSGADLAHWLASRKTCDSVE